MPKTPDGLFDEATALGAGWTHGSLMRAVAKGQIIRLARGVYVTSAYEITPWRKADAICLSTGGVASHVSAARCHRLWVIEPGDSVTVPAHLHRASRKGLNVHRANLSSDEIVESGMARVTSVSRTCSDLARHHGKWQAVCALDSALRTGQLSKSQLVQLQTQPGRIGECARLADARSESPLETGWRLQFAEAAIDLVPQLPVCIGRSQRYRLDFGDPDRKVGVECDGREVHDAPKAIYADRERANQLAAAGWRIMRVTWSDLLQRPQACLQTLRDLLV